MILTDCCATPQTRPYNGNIIVCTTSAIQTAWSSMDCFTNKNCNTIFDRRSFAPWDGCHHA